MTESEYREHVLFFKELGTTIKAKRKDKNYTQRKLADKSRIKKPTISRIENGRIIMSPYEEMSICASLETTIDQLCDTVAVGEENLNSSDELIINTEPKNEINNSLYQPLETPPKEKYDNDMYLFHQQCSVHMVMLVIYVSVLSFWSSGMELILVSLFGIGYFCFLINALEYKLVGTISAVVRWLGYIVMLAYLSLCGNIILNGAIIYITWLIGARKKKKCMIMKQANI